MVHYSYLEDLSLRILGFDRVMHTTLQKFSYIMLVNIKTLKLTGFFCRYRPRR